MVIDDLNLRQHFRGEVGLLRNLRKAQGQNSQGRFDFGVDYLDDCLGGVFPGDLILIGAKSGHGKTSLVSNLALAGLRQKKSVFCFGLEAFEGEFSARLLYRELAKKHVGNRIDFLGWWRGQCPELDKHYDHSVAKLEEELKNLHTIYKGPRGYSNSDLYHNLQEIRSQAGLVILDHVHVIDAVDSLSEQQKTIGLLLDFALVEKIPVVAVSHVRKDEAKPWKILPVMEDLHGHSDLYKKALQVIMLGRDTTKTDTGATLFRVEKSRFGRASSDLIGRVYYDTTRGTYLPGYEMGYLKWNKTTKEMGLETLKEYPWWAKRATMPEGMVL